jgi:hypothetical protein
MKCYGYGTVVTFAKKCSTKGGEIYQLSNCRLAKNDSAPWSYLTGVRF